MTRDCIHQEGQPVMNTECKDLTSMMSCGMPGADGERCGQPASPLLPAGICGTHGLQVWGAVHALLNERVAEALAATEPTGTGRQTP